MTSAPVVPPVLRGVQEPRVCWIPEYTSSAGDEAIELAALAGLDLDPWQQFVLRHALGERADGKWAAFEVGVNVPRQNGKGSILEARELAGLFVLGERLITHSAHQFDTSLEAFRRLRNLIQDTPELHARVKPKGYRNSHGEEGIELKTGQRIRFRTRTKSGGRGFTGDCLILDEAMILPESAHGALLPTLSARPNPQVWYTGSAVDQEVHEEGVVWAGIRERGHRGGEVGLMYVEWSADAENPDEVDALDQYGWAQANPGLGIRISSEHIAREQRSLGSRGFAVERLGVGDWPRTDGEVGAAIDLETWNALADPASGVEDPVVFAFDVRPDRSGSSIGVAGIREDGHTHIEVVEQKRGTGWLVERLKDLTEAHDAAAVICDSMSPAAAIIPQLEAAGVLVETVTAREYADACGRIFDAADQGTLRHLGQPPLASALKGAKQRPLGDAWAWSRKSSTVDISPLVACTLALWKLEESEIGQNFILEVFG
jgi:hypothetical protein